MISKWSKWFIHLDANCGCKVYSRSREENTEYQQDTVYQYRIKENKNCKLHYKQKGK